MQIVTNEPHVKRNRLIAQILFIVSLVILIGGLIFTNTIALSTNALMIVPCIVMPIGLITTLISVRLTNQYVRPPHPEVAIREGVRGLSRDGILYNYVAPVNHVLVAPYGVFTLTTRLQDSRFKIEGDKWTSWKARGPLAPLFLFLKQEGLGDPFKDAASEAEAIQALVDKALPLANIKVQPIVVFTSTRATLEVIDPTIPVVHADPKQKPSLKNQLRDEKRRDDAALLTAEQIEAIDDAILARMSQKQRESQLVEEV